MRRALILWRVEKMIEEPKISIWLVSILASFAMLIVSSVIVLLLRLIEKKTVAWIPEIWGIVFLILIFSYALYHYIFLKILTKKAIQAS